jgi:bacteriocin biosynthesis cyclodehydratase domain-containing protein
MTDAIRLTPGAPGGVALTWSGQFGERVCALLAAGFGGGREPRSGAGAVPAAFSSGAGLVVLALWRPYPELCELADELAFRHGAAWLPVIMEPAAIRVGPLVLPSAGPCFRCYARRRDQHDRQPWSTAALQAAYDRDPGCGPEGFLPHHARLAAGIAGSAVAGLITGAGQQQGQPEPGQVMTIRLLAGDVLVSHVVACHGCDRCGGPVPSVDSRWLSRLAAAQHDRPVPAARQSRESAACGAGRRVVAAR